ncbi:hypothetical protein N7447_001603 [Penicillium robsamsonii]|uniref:uncharacterized protein n=1 Tax=Penicillium robsamsonii TaxID=1792511 RepID=UPI0025472876|nr:uncharacterized protein N7447_001603 [Penicillium robsamsonii]KAJ5835577.1 hypothetical protein N7447_001603 [Penicillium robsamsonii]
MLLPLGLEEAQARDPEIAREFEGRDFIFHPDGDHGSMYTHVVDSNLAFIPKSVTQIIPRRARVGTVTETEYTTAYLVHPNAAALATTRSPRTNTSTLRSTSPTEITLTNDLPYTGTKLRQTSWPTCSYNTTSGQTQRSSMFQLTGG